MAEDVEGNDSLGPDLKEGHRRSSNGALGGPAAGLGERREFGVGRKKKGKLNFLPRPRALKSLKPAAPVVPAERAVLPPAAILQVAEKLQGTVVPVVSPVVPILSEKT